MAFVRLFIMFLTATCEFRFDPVSAVTFCFDYCCFTLGRLSTLLLYGIATADDSSTPSDEVPSQTKHVLVTPAETDTVVAVTVDTPVDEDL